MSQTTETTDDEGGLFDGTLSPEELEAKTGWGPRTILRREAEGLPFIKVGNLKRYPIAAARAWILSHQRNAAPAPRGPGRPRKHAA